MLRTGFALLLLVAGVSQAADVSLVELAKRSKRKASTTRVITNETVGKGAGRVSMGSQPKAASPAAPAAPAATTATAAPAQQASGTNAAPAGYSQTRKNSSLPTSSARNVEPQSSARSTEPTSTARTITPTSTVRTVDPVSTVRTSTPQSTARNVPTDEPPR